MNIQTPKGLIIIFISLFTTLSIITVLYSIKKNAEREMRTAINQEVRIKKEAEKIIKNLPIFQTSIQQGDVKAIIYLNNKNKKLSCNEKNIPYIKNKHTISFLISAQYNSTKNIICTLGEKIIVNAKINKGNFIKIPLNVPQQYHTIPNKELIRIKKEKALLKEIYNNSNEILLSQHLNEIQFERKTSQYGEQRIYQNGAKSIHNGLDYGVEKGTTTTAIGKGNVVLAKELYFCGNTVLIDHGLNIFSLYCHLDEINVTEGEKISKTKIIGTIGDSGLATGPHLHLSVKVNDNWVNPIKIINEINNL